MVFQLLEGGAKQVSHPGESVVKCLTKLGIYYSQTCVQRLPLGPQISGRCREVVIVQRLFK